MVLAIRSGSRSGSSPACGPHSILGRGIMAGSIVGFSLPTFWVGLVLIMVFSVHLGWLPPNGRGRDR
jgi:peptide/nickel transport system permease protein